MDRFQVTSNLIEFFVDGGETATITNVGSVTVYGARVMFPDTGTATWTLAPGASRTESGGQVWARTAAGVSSILRVDRDPTGTSVDVGSGVPVAVAPIASPTFTGTVTSPGITFPASTVAAGGISLGGDTNLYRSAAGVLRTDSNMIMGGTLSVATTATTYGQINLPAATVSTGGIGFGTDTNLYRAAAGVLKTDGSIGFFGVTAPSAKPANPTTLAQVITILQGYGMCA